MRNRSREVRKARAFAKLRRAEASPWTTVRVYRGLYYLAHSWRSKWHHAWPLHWPVFAPQPGDVEIDPGDMPF